MLPLASRLPGAKQPEGDLKLPMEWQTRLIQGKSMSSTGKGVAMCFMAKKSHSSWGVSAARMPSNGSVDYTKMGL